MNRALLVGINTYPGCPLSGCVNDITDMANFLISNCGFKSDEVRLITDGRATTDAILERLNWLVNGVNPNDRIFFHDSGHGAQYPARGRNDEIDGQYEVFCPVDFDWSERHMIKDKQFVEIFSKLPNGVKFNWLSDSCHSGDLDRGLGSFDAKILHSKNYPMPACIAWRHRIAKDKGIMVNRGMVNGKLDVGYISGCMSNQTSADASFGGRPNGALTYFFLKNIKGNLDKPLNVVTQLIISDLKDKGFSQVPQCEGARSAQPFLG